MSAKDQKETPNKVSAKATTTSNPVVSSRIALFTNHQKPLPPPPSAGVKSPAKKFKPVTLDTNGQQSQQQLMAELKKRQTPASSSGSAAPTAATTMETKNSSAAPLSGSVATSAEITAEDLQRLTEIAMIRADYMGLLRELQQSAEQPGSFELTDITTVLDRTEELEEKLRNITIRAKTATPPSADAIWSQGMIEAKAKRLTTAINRAAFQLGVIVNPANFSDENIATTRQTTLTAINSFYDDKFKEATTAATVTHPAPTSPTTDLSAQAGSSLSATSTITIAKSAATAVADPASTAGGLPAGLFPRRFTHSSARAGSALSATNTVEASSDARLEHLSRPKPTARKKRAESSQSVAQFNGKR